MASRWDELAADLVGRATAEQVAARSAHAAEITRADLADTSFLERLRAATGATVSLELRGVGLLPEALVVTVGRDGCVLREMSAGGGFSRELLVPYLSLVTMRGAGSRAVSDRSVRPVDLRLGMGHWLRACVRERARVEVVLVDGTARSGTLDAVGLDYLELAEHAVDAPRRWSQVTGHRLVPMHAVGAVVRHRSP